MTGLENAIEKIKEKLGTCCDDANCMQDWGMRLALQILKEEVEKESKAKYYCADCDHEIFQKVRSGEVDKYKSGKANDCPLCGAEAQEFEWNGVDQVQCINEGCFLYLTHIHLGEWNDLFLKSEKESKCEKPCDKCRHWQGDTCSEACTHIKYNKGLYPDLFEPKGKSE